jgi:hypothetical protein
MFVKATREIFMALSCHISLLVHLANETESPAGPGFAAAEG